MVLGATASASIEQARGATSSAPSRHAFSGSDRLHSLVRSGTFIESMDFAVYSPIVERQRGIPNILFLCFSSLRVCFISPCLSPEWGDRP